MSGLSARLAARAAKRLWHALATPPSWRHSWTPIRHPDGTWQVQVDDLDQGLVGIGPVHKTLVDCAAWGRRMAQGGGPDARDGC